MKIRKVLLIAVGYLVAALGSNSILAKVDIANLINVSNLYVGLDVLKTNYSTQEHYGRNVFGRDPMAFNVFAGYKLPRDFFVEVGYETHKTKNRSVEDVAIDQFPGYVGIPNNNLFDTSTKIKITHPYLGVGFNYSMPILKGTSITGLFGLSLTRLKAQFLLPEVLTYRKNFVKRKISPLLKANLNYDFNENLGMHFTVTWHRLTNFQANPKELTSNSIEIRMKNSYSYGVGVIYSF